MKRRHPSSIIHHPSSQKGQSLVEVMVAITALTVGFLGISSLLSRSLALNRVTTNEVTATYLASEGVEVAKNLIDHDVYGALGWDTCFGSGGDFELDYTTIDCKTELTRFTGGGRPLWYHTDTHLYNYISNGGSATSFTRMIKVIPVGDEITVIAVVWWAGLNGAQGNINLEDHFYKWY
jgi:hypothetical protein